MTSNTTVFFAKVKPDAKIPTKREEDAGYDIYASFDEDYIVFNPHETKLIPTGIASALSPDYFFRLVERGSNSSKGIGQRAGVIDSGYRGEWFVGLTNHNDTIIVISKLSEDETRDIIRKNLIKNLSNYISDRIVIYPYSKAICQALLLPVPKSNISEISYDALQTIESDRGIGKVGSSGK